MMWNTFITPIPTCIISVVTGSRILPSSFLKNRKPILPATNTVNFYLYKKEIPRKNNGRANEWEQKAPGTNWVYRWLLMERSLKISGSIFQNLIKSFMIDFQKIFPMNVTLLI